ncbi:hypothetical protein HM1_1153 [Heliomicrobium modesticaldum Ice1]|uniref:Uncharacterized protein n=1 Tax=Heliobacterium modesticaldum (strain ATCC 51547 / Ice1) TaxID=498761 RepID=B0THI3_HELMI|nr:hypothetical protein HM1_1153 [Heliomicrobium modesticaldum Ice1]
MDFDGLLVILDDVVAVFFCRDQVACCCIAFSGVNRWRYPF